MVAWEQREEERGRMAKGRSELWGQKAEYVHYLDCDDFYRYIGKLKFIKIYTLNMYRLLYVCQLYFSNTFTERKIGHIS